MVEMAGSAGSSHGQELGDRATEPGLPGEHHGLRQLPSCPEHQLPGCKLGKEGPILVSHLLLLSGSLGLVPHPHCPLGPSRKSSQTTTSLWKSLSEHELGACICVYTCACPHVYVYL